jgi:hypothetical protein
LFDGRSAGIVDLVAADYGDPVGTATTQGVEHAR